MAGVRLPGVLCVVTNALPIDAGTLVRSNTPTPGTIQGNVDRARPLGHGDHADANSATFRETHSLGTDVEFSAIPIVEKPNQNVVIKFEEKDLSIGTARYAGAKPISKNLSMKGHSAMAHANVEVHLYDDRGNEVPMTRRLVRYWAIMPDPSATVENLSQWRIVGLEQSEFSPFAVSPGEKAAEANFGWDRPGARDAPGLQGIAPNVDQPFGQLQEFLIGNEKVGGAYFQTYVPEDSQKVRIINTSELKLSAGDYRAVLRLIDSGHYAKTMSNKLFFMPMAKTSDIIPYPKNWKEKK